MPDIQHKPIIGIYGGTFDPIHNAHIIPVQQAAGQVGVEKVRLIPCHIPPHKSSPKTKPSDRLAMVQMVANNYPLFVADDRELRSHKYSYTVETVQELREEYPGHSICFFVGTDSIVNFHKWHRWEAIFDSCHIVVCTRPGFDIQPEKDLHPEVARRITDDIRQIQTKLNGHVLFTETDELPISSTLIRDKLKHKESVEGLLPEYILSYIHQHHLYLT